MGLGNKIGARRIFERWMEWEPGHQAWSTFLNFEYRCGEMANVRRIYEKYVICHPDIASWVKYARFEQSQGNLIRSRQIYERAIEKLGKTPAVEKLYSAYAQFETICHEYKRARIIYKYAIY